MPKPAFAYTDYEPTYDEDETLRDWSGDSYYLHLSTADMSDLWVILSDGVLMGKWQNGRHILDQFKQQMANQGIDWNYYAELVREGAGEMKR